MTVICLWGWALGPAIKQWFGHTLSLSSNTVIHCFSVKLIIFPIKTWIWRTSVWSKNSNFSLKTAHKKSTELCQLIKKQRMNWIFKNPNISSEKTYLLFGKSLTSKETTKLYWNWFPISLRIRVKRLEGKTEIYRLFNNFNQFLYLFFFGAIPLTQWP